MSSNSGYRSEYAGMKKSFRGANGDYKRSASRRGRPGDHDHLVFHDGNQAERLQQLLQGLPQRDVFRRAGHRGLGIDHAGPPARGVKDEVLLRLALEVGRHLRERGVLEIEGDVLPQNLFDPGGASLLRFR